jgi:hypothetical protein
VWLSVHDASDERVQWLARGSKYACCFAAAERKHLSPCMRESAQLDSVDCHDMVSRYSSSRLQAKVAPLQAAGQAMRAGGCVQAFLCLLHLSVSLFLLWWRTTLPSGIPCIGLPRSHILLSR